MCADTLAASVPRGGWQRLSAGPGAKGQRYYHWALITLTAQAGHHWLLNRRHLHHGELAFYRCYSPTLVPLAELIRVAGRRWTIEDSFQAGKGLAGLDEHRVRRWTSWRRWTLLAMIDQALLVVIAANEHTDRPALAGMVKLSSSEIRRLLTAWSAYPATPQSAREPGRTGDDATNTAPGQATTGARRHLDDVHNDLRLEY